MEVRQEYVRAAELEARRYEEVGAADERPAARQRLEHAHRGRPDGEHTRRSFDSVPGRGRDRKALPMYWMLRQIVDRDRSKGVESDMEGHPLDVETLQDARCEVEARRRRRRGP